MKKNIFILLAAILMTSCGSETNSNPNAYTLSCEFNEIPDGEVFLYTRIAEDVNGTMVPKIDTIGKAISKDGKFTFEGELEAPYFYTIGLAKDLGGQSTLTTEGTIFIAQEKASYSGTLKFPVLVNVEKGDLSKAFYDYQNEQAFIDATKNLKALEHLDFDKPENVVKKRKAETAINKIINQYNSAFYKNNDHQPYFYLLTLGDKIKTGKIEELQEISKEIDSISDSLPKTHKIIAFLYKQSIENMTLRKESKIGLDYKEVIGQTKNGNDIKLSEVVNTNKYVLLDFWASWCKPCIAEFPFMKVVHSKYKSKGFEIYGISIDENKDRWLKVIKEEQIPWIDVLMNPEDSYKKDYDVQSIPANFLIETKTGKVIDAGLRQGALAERLSELLD
ncbi:MAG: TlpA disulfide reductase family protein [Bacteroidota bacterium]